MKCIILTEQEAAAVRGETSKGVALEPVPLNDGTYALPERVISDSKHATKLGALGSKSRRDVAETEFASYIVPEPAAPAEASYSFTASEVEELRAAVGKADTVSTDLAEKLSR